MTISPRRVAMGVYNKYNNITIKQHTKPFQVV